MKITTVVMSRKRPQGLLSVLTTLDALSTGTHDITYPVLLDTDDSVTLHHLEMWQEDGMLPKNTVPILADRDRTLNARMNEAAEKFPADLYYFSPDDGFPLMQHWDRVFHAAKDLPAFAWLEKNDPGNATYITVSEKWRKALGRCFPEYFPYWFADTWIAEVHLLAFGKPIAVINQLAVGGKRGRTQGMRDLSFWFKFFAYTRTERIQEAETLAKAYGFTANVLQTRQHFLQQLEEGDQYQQRRVPVYEKGLEANRDEPSPAYMKAKARAEEMMAVTP